MKPCLLLLTCANTKEAEQITHVLLGKKLVVCIKQTKVISNFLWQSKTNQANEVLLIMESVEELFDKIETTVRQIHSYDTVVLVSVPINKVSTGIESWMKSEMKVK